VLFVKPKMSFPYCVIILHTKFTYEGVPVSLWEFYFCNFTPGRLVKAKKYWLVFLDRYVVSFRRQASKLRTEPVFARSVIPRVYAHSANWFTTVRQSTLGRTNFYQLRQTTCLRTFSQLHYRYQYFMPTIVGLNQLSVDASYPVPTHSQPIRLFYANQIRTETFLLMRQKAKHVSTHFNDQLH
jgi:hypothetical protein